MSVALGIVHAVSSLNRCRPANDQLVPEVVGISDGHGLTEHYLICNERGEAAACGYSEALLLADLNRQLSPADYLARFYGKLVAEYERAVSETLFGGVVR